jgi:hypothetical protein
MDGRKIFVIGMNKTATVTLHQLFLLNNLKSQHADTTNFPVEWNLDLYDCFSDNANQLCNNFKMLNEKCQNAIYILNCRSLDSWLLSRLKHGIFHKEEWAIPKNNVGCCTFWAKIRNKYHLSILEYFKDSPEKLVIVNIEKDKWIEYLCSILNLEQTAIDPCHVIPSDPVLHNSIIKDIDTVFLKYKSDRKQLLIDDIELSNQYLQIYRNNILPISPQA